MAIFSGKDGTLYVGASEVTPVSNWTLRLSSNHRRYVANDTNGWNKRVAGGKDSSGAFQLKADDSGPLPVDEGDNVTLKLHVDDTGNNYYEVPAVVDRIDVEVDINTGRIVAYVIDFSGNGAVIKNGIVAASGG